MKKTLFVLPLAVLLLTLTIGVAAASYQYEDPALCVAGKWLIVDAANPAAVRVFVPEDVPYGDQQAGGCATPGPKVALLQIVKERGKHATMHVQIDGKGAATPSVTVSYGDVVTVKANKGKGVLNFWFAVPPSGD